LHGASGKPYFGGFGLQLGQQSLVTYGLLSSSHTGRAAYPFLHSARASRVHFAGLQFGHPSDSLSGLSVPSQGLGTAHCFSPYALHFGFIFLTHAFFVHICVIVPFLTMHSLQPSNHTVQPSGGAGAPSPEATAAKRKATKNFMVLSQ
jgi:hypothetical protein